VKISDLAFWRSTVPEVGRSGGRPMRTKRAQPFGLRAGRTPGRPSESFAL